MDTPGEDLPRRVAAAARAPLGEATGLPPEAYHSEALYALEQEHIFAKEWHCVGLAAEVPGPGDYLTFTIAEQPVVVVRGADGALRAFANVCRHRMMRLVEGRGTCSHFVCPYHAWSYGLDGRLIAAPHMNGLDKGQHALKPLRCELWQGWIYITLDNQAESVADRLDELAPVVGRYRMAGYRPVIAEDFRWRTNWKILSENFMESYHLPVAHRETVGAWITVDDMGFPESTHDSFTYQTFVKREDAKYGRARPGNDHLEGAWRGTSVMPTVFPAHMYVLAPDHLWYLTLRPEGVDSVQVRFGVALAPEAMPEDDRREAEIAELRAFFDKVNEEDRILVEAVFENAKAPLSSAGPLSWMEREIHDFNRYLARRLADA
ncbi:MAG: SRPBCC family protein [Pseudomonadota bacterium]